LDASFRSAITEFYSRLGRPKLSTGSLDLDLLLGGIEMGKLYLFYGNEDDGIADRLLHKLLVNGLKPESEGGFGGKCIYLNCGNYKQTRTILDVDLVTELIKLAGLDVPSALGKIYTVCAFSDEQLIKAVETVEELVKKDPEIRVVAVQQIAKLFSPPLSRKRNRGDFQKLVLKLRQIGVEHQISLVATCRLGKIRFGSLPWPEGGDYLRHEANVITYLVSEDPNRFIGVAYLLKHPERIPGSCKVEFKQEEEKVGRVTKSFRERIQNEMEDLKKNYREALKDRARQEAFDKIWEAWASEEGAMINSAVPTALDILLLTAIIDNRKSIEEIRRDLSAKL